MKSCILIKHLLYSKQGNYSSPKLAKIRISKSADISITLAFQPPKIKRHSTPRETNVTGLLFLKQFLLIRGVFKKFCKYIYRKYTKHWNLISF